MSTILHIGRSRGKTTFALVTVKISYIIYFDLEIIRISSRETEKRKIVKTKQKKKKKNTKNKQTNKQTKKKQTSKIITIKKSSKM